MSTSTCKQCRKGQAEHPETLCGGCLALTSTLGILRGNWWSKSHRKLAEEVLIQASRQVRAVHSLDTGLQSFSDSCEARLRKVVAGHQRPPEPRHPPTRRSVPVLREAPPRSGVPPEEEAVHPEEAEPAAATRGRSASSAPDYGSPSESNLSSPRGNPLLRLLPLILVWVRLIIGGGVGHVGRGPIARGPITVVEQSIKNTIANTISQEVSGINTGVLRSPLPVAGRPGKSWTQISRMVTSVREPEFPPSPCLEEAEEVPAAAPEGYPDEPTEFSTFNVRFWERGDIPLGSVLTFKHPEETTEGAAPSMIAVLVQSFKADENGYSLGVRILGGMSAAAREWGIKRFSKEKRMLHLCRDPSDLFCQVDRSVHVQEFCLWPPGTFKGDYADKKFMKEMDEFLKGLKKKDGDPETVGPEEPIDDGAGAEEKLASLRQKLLIANQLGMEGV